MDPEYRPLKTLEDYRTLNGHPVLLQGTGVVHADSHPDDFHRDEYGLLEFAKQETKSGAALD